MCNTPALLRPSSVLWLSGYGRKQYTKCGFDILLFRLFAFQCDGEFLYSFVPGGQLHHFCIL